jgi:PAS domain S-box-containing protein
MTMDNSAPPDSASQGTTNDADDLGAVDLPRPSEELFRLLVQSVKDYAIFMLDPRGVVSTWNEGAQRIKGYKASEIIGRHFSQFYTEVDKASGKPARELEIASRVGKYEEEGWRVRKDGTLFWASVVITAVHNDEGALVGFAKVTRDLTARREAQQREIADASMVAAQEAARTAAEQRADELKRMAEELRSRTSELEARTREAEQANRAKSEFLAAMSHELRTPLNAIGGYAELLLMGIPGPVNEEQREQITRMQRSQQHLLGIINDILNFSRIEAGQLTYDMAGVPLEATIESVSHMIEPQANTRGLHFEAAPCDPSLAVWADRAKVEQILLNLLSNAVKFTAAGGTVWLSCVNQGEMVAIVVRDSGIGIPPEQLESIFEPFVQVGRTLTTSQDGTGLGLAISRDLARAMGGDIEVESHIDRGSAFTLTLRRF